jgi:hypothetical protein
MTLHYLRTKDGKELDFLICADRQPTHLIEVKSTNGEPAPAFNYFSRYFPQTKLIQLVKDLPREKTYPHGPEIRSLISWLINLDLR